MSSISWLDRLSGAIIRYLGADMPQRGTIEFAGSGVVVTDNAGNDKTVVTISAGGPTPTGTGFRHVTSGVEDGASVAVNLASAHVTGLLPGSNMVASTTSVPGSMSAADKTKLDGIQKQGAASAIGALNIDWSLAGVYTKTLSAGGNTITFSNAASGMMIVVRLTGAASTVTWPTVKWAGGTPPTQTASGTDVYTFVHDGTNIYGSVVQAMA